jgi:hypothetical protein
MCACISCYCLLLHSVMSIVVILAQRGSSAEGANMLSVASDNVHCLVFLRVVMFFYIFLCSVIKFEFISYCSLGLSHTVVCGHLIL